MADSADEGEILLFQSSLGQAVIRAIRFYATSAPSWWLFQVASLGHRSQPPRVPLESIHLAEEVVHNDYEGGMRDVE